MPVGDLLNQPGFTIGEANGPLIVVRCRRRVPSRDAIDRCEIGRQMLTIGLATENQALGYFIWQGALGGRPLCPHHEEHSTDEHAGGARHLEPRGAAVPVSLRSDAKVHG